MIVRERSKKLTFSGDVIHFIALSGAIPWILDLKICSKFQSCTRIIAKRPGQPMSSINCVHIRVLNTFLCVEYRLLLDLILPENV